MDLDAHKKLPPPPTSLDTYSDLIEPWALNRSFTVNTKAPPDIFCIDETKLDQRFGNAQFLVENYQFPSIWTDRNSSGGGKFVYVKQGIIVKRLENFGS